MKGALEALLGLTGSSLGEALLSGRAALSPPASTGSSSSLPSPPSFCNGRRSRPVTPSPHPPTAISPCAPLKRLSFAVQKQRALERRGIWSETPTFGSRGDWGFITAGCRPTSSECVSCTACPQNPFRRQVPRTNTRSHQLLPGGAALRVASARVCGSQH